MLETEYRAEPQVTNPENREASRIIHDSAYAFDWGQRYIRQDHLERFLPLVDGVVRRIKRQLPAHIEEEDLRSVGIIGLVSAVRKYDRAQENTFEAYAVLRIRGAILDELRRMDVLPRTAREKARRLRDVVGNLEQKLGRVPTEIEVRRDMGLSVREYDRYKRNVQTVNFISLDKEINHQRGEDINLHEAIADEGQKPSYETIERKEMISNLSEKLSRLPDRQQKILAMYYYEGMKLAEIAEVFQVTEARICQIHSQAIGTLRRYMASSSVA